MNTKWGKQLTKMKGVRILFGSLLPHIAVRVSTLSQLLVQKAHFLAQRLAALLRSSAILPTVLKTLVRKICVGMVNGGVAVIFRYLPGKWSGKTVQEERTRASLPPRHSNSNVGVEACVTRKLDMEAGSGSEGEGEEGGGAREKEKLRQKEKWR